jgi:RHS repeat-associated protein
MTRPVHVDTLIRIAAAVALVGWAQSAYADPQDPILGDDPVSLDATGPAASSFQVGDYGVAEQSGAATYRYPIPVPPGRLGVAPSLALTYSSQAPLRGGVAAGWSLDLPRIERDTAAGTLDAERFTAAFGGSSGRLVAVPDASLFGGLPHRAQQDGAFTRFERIDDPESGQRWLAASTDGSVHVFGETPDATDGVSRWLLSRSTDVHGNSVVYQWSRVHDLAGELIDFAIRRIEYTSNPGAGLAAHAAVTFEYAAPEHCAGSRVPIGASADYRLGHLYLEGALRLTAIGTEVRDTPGGSWRTVQRVTLSYDEEALACDGPTAPMRFVTALDRVGFDREGLATEAPTVSFVYEPWSDGMGGAVQQVDIPPTHAGTNLELESTLLEMNGDGIPDRVHVEVNAAFDVCELVWNRGDFGGGYSGGRRMWLPTAPWPGAPPSTGDAGRCTLMGQNIGFCTVNAYRFADVDGDGDDDLLTQLFHNAGENPDSILGFAATPTADEPSGPEGPGDPQDPPTVCVRTSHETADHQQVWFVYRNTGEAFELMPHRCSADERRCTLTKIPLAPEGNDGALGKGAAFSHQAMLDMDGDSRLDLVHDPVGTCLIDEEQKRCWHVYPGDGNGSFGPRTSWALPFDSRISLTGGDPVGTVPRLLHGVSGVEDVNGDGLPDLLRFDGAETSVHLSTGRRFAEASIPLGGAHPIFRTRASSERSYDSYHVDVDGDGLPDLIDLSGDEPTWHPNAGVGFLAPRSLPPVWASAKRRIVAGIGEEPVIGTYRWGLMTDFADGNGDGRRDLLRWVSDSSVEIRGQQLDGPLPRRLLHVSSAGRGILFSYAPITDPEVVERGGSDGREMPHVPWVVKRILTSDVTDTPGIASIDVTHYSYADPVYGTQTGTPCDNELEDRPCDARRFLGFSRVQKELPLGGRVVREYAYGQEGDAEGRLARETTYDRVGPDVHIPVLREDYAWTFRPLFGGLSVFTHLASKLTHVCPGGAPECARGEGLRHSAEQWVALPDEDAATLYVRASTMEGEGADLSDVYRRTDSAYDVRYDAPPYLVLSTLREGSTGGGEVIERSETEHDARGRPILEHAFVDASEVATTERQFDPATGNLIAITKPQQYATGGASSFIGYDAHHVYPATSINELGHRVDMLHDPGTGAVLEASGPNAGQLEASVYDGFGRLLETTVSLDGSSLTVIGSAAYFDDVVPRRVRTERRIDLAGAVIGATESALDGSGRVISESDFLEGGAVATTTYRYDAGQLVEMLSPDPRTDSGATVPYLWSYDSLGRVRSFQRPDGSSVAVSHEGLVREIDEGSSGGRRILGGDVFGRLVHVEEIGGASGPALWSYAFDERDDLVELLNADGSATQFAHDFLGRRLAVTRGTRTWLYGYDLNGNVVASTSPTPAGAPLADYTTTIHYDALDRVVRRVPASRGLSGARLAELGIGPIELFYDGAEPFSIGRLSRVALPFGSVLYRYEPRGLPIFEQRSFALGGQKPLAATQWVQREFDAQGNLTASGHDDGTVWRAFYDSRSLPASVEWLDPVAGGFRRVAAYARSLAGQPRSRLTDFGQRRAMDYDALGRPASDEIYAGSTLRAWRSYAYSETSDLVAVRGATGALSASADFAYDGLHRLLAAVGPGPYRGSFSYSPAGNLAEAQVAGDGSAPRNVRYEYGALDAHAVDALIDRVTGQPLLELDYDAAGNVRGRHGPGGSSSFEWDADERLREAITMGGREVYLYDHSGARVLASDGKLVRFWFGASETHFDKGKQTRRWIHVGPGGTLARVESGAKPPRDVPPPGVPANPPVPFAPRIELQYADALQNLMLAMGPTGQETASFLYGAFGEVVAANGAEAHRRQFNDKENDALTGLRYYGFRYYDPLLLRWTGADPLFRFAPDLALDQPQRMNLYSFSLNNAVRYYDPDGRDVRFGIGASGMSCSGGGFCAGGDEEEDEEDPDSDSSSDEDDDGEEESDDEASKRPKDSEPAPIEKVVVVTKDKVVDEVQDAAIEKAEKVIKAKEGALKGRVGVVTGGLQIREGVRKGDAVAVADGAVDVATGGAEIVNAATKGGSKVAAHALKKLSPIGWLITAFEFGWEAGSGVDDLITGEIYDTGDEWEYEPFEHYSPPVKTAPIGPRSLGWD